MQHKFCTKSLMFFFGLGLQQFLYLSKVHTQEITKFTHICPKFIDQNLLRKGHIHFTLGRVKHNIPVSKRNFPLQLQNKIQKHYI